MLQITLHYFPFNTNVAFLQIKQDEVHSYPEYIAIFYIHVTSSIFALAAGFTQFNARLLRSYPKVHRYVGRSYAYIVLLFSAPSGIYIGFHANGGLIAKISFITLGILWIYFTLRGIKAIKTKSVIQHQAFMLRSFALAFSAVTLRFWKVVLVLLFEPNPMDVYKIIAWLGWVPNLLAIEWYISKKLRK
jgi:hypothetical protein